MSTALVALTPILGASFAFLFRRIGRNAAAVGAAVITALALVLLLSQAGAVLAGEAVAFRAAWIPQINLTFSFFIDELSLFFAGLILGMGLLVIVYARYYLSAADPIGRFYSCLLLFQGAMLGIVLSDNILLMLVFWELTSLSSFLLIGYWSHRPDSRQGARMALIVTGGGGLALIAGMLMLGEIAGTYELSEIIRRGEEVRQSQLFGPTLALILLGAFTKSAQFPFHFWLPHAMAAPTPVSAYLHSATMVKAGIFLLARLSPVFAGTELWFLTVSLAGIVTMVIAAWIALFKDDLKQVLAFSTVSHLGLITMLLGIGTPMATVTAIFHILNHAAFKAALFMSAGIVDHEAGTRDLRRLGGLARLMPLTAGLTLIASAAMAGVPLLNGFVSKEMMLQEASGMVYAGFPWLFPLLCTAAAVLSVAYSARLAWVTFFGPLQHGAAHPPHDPAFGMTLPVIVLIVPVIVFGVMPALAEPLVAAAASAAFGAALPEFHLTLWHGFSPALAMSAIALAAGPLLLRFYPSLERVRQVAPRPDAKRLFDAAVNISIAAARRCTELLHTSDLQRYALIVVVSVIALGAFGFWSAEHAPGNRPLLEVNLPASVAWAVLLAVCVLAALRHNQRLLLLVATGATGLVVSLLFLQFSAPDLALTQISVEVVSTILFLLALNLLPKATPHETGRGRRALHGVVALGCGGAVMSLAYSVLTRGFDSISAYHLAEAKPGGGGTNVVNIILVDFRAYDTFGEIIVLGIAGLAILALLDPALNGKLLSRRTEARPALRREQPHPLILVVATRVMLPLALTAGVYIFLRGHNLPGGGFIAGIVVAIAFIMQYIASGYAWAHERNRLDPRLMIGAGVVLAGVTGLGSWFFGHPLLTSAHGGFDLPLIGHIELSSVIAFDLGVFFTVVGTVLVALASISQVEGPEDTRQPEDLLRPPAPAPEPEPEPAVRAPREKETV
jgi:multicomponent K+:H+ antiporter subunit A